MKSILQEKMKNYWYIDEKGILSLVSQCTDSFKSETTSVNTISKERKTGLNLAVKALAAIFGSAEAKTNIEQNTSTIIQESNKITKKVEQHLVQLIDYLKESNQLHYYDDIDQLFVVKEELLPLFCIASIPFYLDKEYYLENTDRARLFFEEEIFDIHKYIMKEKFVLFKSEIDKQSSNVSIWRRIVLGASLEKWVHVRTDKDGNPIFSQLSHLGIILRASMSSPIKIKFMGPITKMGGSLYIKPFAIWDI